MDHQQARKNKELQFELIKLDSELEQEINKGKHLEKLLEAERARNHDLSRRLKESEILEEKMKELLNNERENNHEKELFYKKRQKELQTFKSKYIELEKNLSIVKNENDTLFNEKDALLHKLANAEILICDLRSTIKNIVSVKTKLEDQVKHLEERNKSLTIDVTQMQEIIDSMRNHDLSNSSMFSPVRSIGENMGAAVVELQLAEKLEEISRLEQETQTLLTHLHDCQQKLASSEHKLSEERCQHNATLQKCVELENHLANKNEELCLSHLQLDELKLHCTSLKTELNIRTVEISSKCREFESLQSRIKETESLLSVVQEHKADLLQKLGSTNSELDCCKAELNEATQYLVEKTRNLETAQSELIISSEKINELQVQLEVLNTQLSEKQQDLTETMTQLNLTKDECNTLRLDFTCVLEEKAKVDLALTERNSQLTTVNEQLIILGNQLEAQIAANQLLLAEKGEISVKFEQEVKILLTKVEMLQQALNTTEKTLVEEIEQHRVTRERYIDLQNCITLKDEELSLACKRIDELSLKSNTLQTNLHTKIEEISCKCRELESLQCRIKETESQLSVVQEHEAGLLQKLESTNSELDYCKAELNEAMKNLGEKTHNLESAQNELIISSEKINELQQQYDMLNSQMTVKHEALSKTVNVLNLTKDEYDKLKLDLSSVLEEKAKVASELLDRERLLQITEEQCLSLKNQLKSDEEEAMRMQHELSNATQYLENEKLQHQLLQESYKGKVQELVVAVEAFQTLAEEKHTLETHSSDLERKLKDLTWELEKTRAEMGVQLTDVEFKRSSLQSQLLELENSLESSKTELRSSKDVLENTCKELDKMSKAFVKERNCVENLEALIYEKDHEISACNGKLDEISLKMSKLSEEMITKNSEIMKYNDDLGHVKSENIELLNQLSLKCNAEINLQNELQNIKEHVNDLMKNMLTKDSEVSKLSEELNISQLHVRELGEKFRKKEEELQEQRTQLHIECDVVKNLEIKIGELSAKLELESVETVACKTDLLREIEDNKDLTEDLARKSQELKKCYEELAVLKCEIACASTKIVSLQSEIIEKESDNLKYVDELVKTEAKISLLEESLVKKCNEVQCSEAQAAYFKIEFDSVKQKLESLQSILVSKENEERELNEKLLKSISEGSILNYQVVQLQSEVSQLREKLTTKEFELNERKIQLETADARIAELKSKSADMDAVQDIYTKKNCDYVAQIEDLQEQLDHVSSTLANQGHSYNELKKKMLKKETELSQCNTQCNMYQLEMEKLKVQVDQTKVALREARSQYQQLSTAHQALINSKDNSNQQMLELQTALQDKYIKKFQAVKAKLTQAYDTDVKSLQDELTTSKEKQQKCLDNFLHYKKRASDLEQQLQVQANTLKQEMAAKKFLEAKIADLEKNISISKRRQSRTYADANRKIQSSEKNSNKNDTSNSSTGSLHPLLVGMGCMFKMEDEEGEEFNSKFLDDLKAGRGVSNDSDWGRASELARRNTLCLPHLQSSYPVETQFLNLPIKDDDLKSGTGLNLNESDCLLPADKKQKDRGHTRYKKPGPPTPGKNTSRGALDDSLTPRSILTEQSSNLLNSTGSNGAITRRTPSRLKLLFKGSRKTAPGRDVTTSTNDENTPLTPRRRDRLFRK